MGHAAVKWVGDVLALLAVAAAALFLWNPGLAWMREGVIYVSAAGSDWQTGGSPERAVATIQRAADLAQPGDTVVILPGTYRERVHVRHGGVEGQPVTFRALQPGTVLLTGAAEQEITRKLAWRDEGNGVFSAVSPWPVYFVRGDGLTLFRCYGLRSLRALSARPGAWGVFHYEKSRLYVKFPDGRSPASHLVEFHGPVPPPAEWWTWKAANAWIEADHLRFEGLRFEFGVGSGIHLWKGADVAVADCLFTGAAVGINAAAGVKPAEGLRVERCLYHNYPQGEWLRKWLAWKDVYASYSQCGLLRSTHDGAVIRHNLVVHGGDGMGVTTADIPVEKGVEVSDNLIAWCTDDAIEFDGFARGIRFEHNLVYDSFVSLGTSPVLAGPVMIRRNLFLHPHGGLNGAQVKLMNNKHGKELRRTIRNVEISRNTFVGNHLYWHDKSPVRDVRVRRNLFAFQRKVGHSWPGGVEEGGNRYMPLSVAGYPEPGLDSRWLRDLVNRKPGQGGEKAGEIARDGRWAMSRPGPRWHDWRSLPATAALMDRLSPELFDR